MTQQPHAAIIADIVAGRLPPGSRLVEHQLADRLGTSRGSVRPILRDLRHLGLVAPAKPGKQERLVVTVPTREDALQVFRAAGALEVAATLEAAGQPVDRRAELAGTLTDINRSLIQPAADRQSSMGEYIAADLTFHDALLTSQAATHATRLWRTLAPLRERYLRMFARDSFIDCWYQEHGAVIAAVADGHCENLRLAVSRHAEQDSSRLVAEIAARESQLGWI